MDERPATLAGVPRAATGESSLARAVRIIAAFTPDETSLRVSEIARRTGLHVATASRLVAELTSHGLLERGPDREVRVGVRLSARDAVINYTRIAGRLPPHISSSGHVLIAHAPTELQERILSRPLQRYTANTITTPDALRAALAEVRRRGYALVEGHVHEDATGVAVPVRGALGEVVAALSVIVPNDGHAQAHVPVLLAAARGISRSLASGRPPA